MLLVNWFCSLVLPIGFHCNSLILVLCSGVPRLFTLVCKFYLILQFQFYHVRCLVEFSGVCCAELFFFSFLFSLSLPSCDFLGVRLWIKVNLPWNPVSCTFMRVQHHNAWNKPNVMNFKSEIRFAYDLTGRIFAIVLNIQ